MATYPDWDVGQRFLILCKDFFFPDINYLEIFDPLLYFDPFFLVGTLGLFNRMSGQLFWKSNDNMVVFQV